MTFDEVSQKFEWNVYSRKTNRSEKVEHVPVEYLDEEDKSGLLLLIKKGCTFISSHSSLDKDITVEGIIKKS